MRARVTPSRIGAPGSINAYSVGGRFIPAPEHFILSDTDKLHFPVRAIDYRAPLGTGGQPRQYVGHTLRVNRWDSGTETNDTSSLTGNEFNDIVQDMMICDGPTAGTAVLLVVFGSGNPNPDANTQTGCYYRSLTTDTTPWTAATAADTSKLTAWGLLKAGPDLYAVCDAGRAGALFDYRISKCPPGSDPTLSASWGNGIEVGTPEWAITGLAAIGDSPVVGKPDGLYYYDTQTRRYENVLKHYELVPHALNGKGMLAVTGGVVYPTHDGGLYFFDGVAVQEISPKKLWPVMGKDIGNSRVTAIADRGDVLALVMETGYQTTQNANIKVYKTTSGTTTDITDDCVDGDLGTGGVVDSLASGSTLDIWADIPFIGVIFHITRKPNDTVAAVWGTLSYSSADDTFTAFAGFKDGTRLQGKKSDADTGGSFSYVAFPPSASAGIVQPTNVNAHDLIQAVDFAYTGADDIAGQYGMRLTLSGGNFDADVEIDEVEIIPARAGMPNGGLYTAGTNFTAKHRAGMTQSVVLLKRERTTGFVPHDTYTVDSFGAVHAMAYHSGRLGQANGQQNLGQPLFLHGRYRTIAISDGPTRDPARDRRLITVQPGSTKPGPLYQIFHDWDGGDSVELKTISEVRIDTRYLQPTDEWEVFFQHDDYDITSVAKNQGGPIVFKPPKTHFRYLNGWIGVKRAATNNEYAPQFLEPIRVEFDFIDEELPQDRAEQVPPAT